jgi:hypothetical protein
MTYKLHYLIYLFCLIPSFENGYSQNTKQEVEKQIKSNEFPGDIPLILKGFDIDLKQEKYYKQKDGKKLSYELKFKHQRYKYSIAVDTLGHLVDIEVKIKQKKMPEKTRNVFNDYLKEAFDKSKIEKIQSQFLPTSKPSSELLKQVVKRPLSPPDYYEIIVVVKEDGEFKKFEFLINLEGKIIKKRRVIRNAYDYIIF